MMVREGKWMGVITFNSRSDSIKMTWMTGIL
jgi:hypothetical protein